MSAVDLATIIGAIAAVAGCVIALLIFLRQRGRLQVTAQLTDQNLSTQIPIEGRNHLTIEALVVLRNYFVEFRPLFRREFWTMWYLGIGLLKSEKNDWVTIEPARRHYMTIPFAERFVLTSVYAETSAGKKFKISLKNSIRLRLLQYKRFKSLPRRTGGNDDDSSSVVSQAQSNTVSRLD